MVNLPAKKRSLGFSQNMAVKWLKPALRNLEGIANYIALDNPERAVTFVQEIREKTNFLPDFPSVGRPGRVPGTRELVVHKNYVVIYRMKSGAIEILRVRHVAQRHPETIQ
jgi:toxin ParE1/3/4